MTKKELTFEIYKCLKKGTIKIITDNVFIFNHYTITDKKINGIAETFKLGPETFKLGPAIFQYGDYSTYNVSFDIINQNTPLRKFFTEYSFKSELKTSKTLLGFTKVEEVGHVVKPEFKSPHPSIYEYKELYELCKDAYNCYMVEKDVKLLDELDKFSSLYYKVIGKSN